MTTRREIRLAQVEYQPNLHHPVRPVTLGVVMEERRGGSWEVVVYGRLPRGDVPGLQLENTWGPFRNVVTGWGELMVKNARELMAPRDAQGSLLDQLAQRWNLNVYLRQPETKVIHSSAELATCAKRWFAKRVSPQPAASIRKRKQKRATHSPVRGSRQQRWLSMSNQLQAHA